jgi:hypothetical protein
VTSLKRSSVPYREATDCKTFQHARNRLPNRNDSLAVKRKGDRSRTSCGELCARSTQGLWTAHDGSLGRSPTRQEKGLRPCRRSKNLYDMSSILLSNSCRRRTQRTKSPHYNDNEKKHSWNVEAGNDSLFSLNERKDRQLSTPVCDRFRP